jgi:biopolymer transport protein ExbD
MRFRSTPRAAPEINLTSLIDILFIVLIFLVLTTTFRQSTSLRLALPEATTGERSDTEPRDLLTVSIDASEQIYLQDQPVSLEELDPLLRSAFEADEPELVIAADARVSHGRVVAVMDSARGAGIRRLRIETVAVMR